MHDARINLAFTTIRHKGFDLPSLAWSGDGEAVEQARALSSRIVTARKAQNQGQKQADCAYADAAADLHELCATNGLTPKDAERAIFVSRLLADIIADEWESVRRTGNGNGWMRLETPFRMVRIGQGRMVPVIDGG